MTRDIFRRMSIEEYRRELGIRDLTYIEGVRVNSEDELSIACVRWFDRVIGDKFGLIHIPNGGSRNAIEAAKFKKMGVRSGTPDYLVCKNGVPVGWLEFKWGGNGLTENQRQFKEQVSGVFKWAEIRTFADFMSALEEWGVYSPKGATMRGVKNHGKER